MLDSSVLNFLMLGTAGVLLIGFLGRVLGKKTAIPYIVWLMFFGLLLGPVLGLLKRNSLLLILQGFLPFQYRFFY